MEGIKSLGTTSFGIGLGLVFADLLDRYIATRTPKDGKRPWMGRNAAAAIQAKPDAMRLGAQAAGAVLASAGAYYTRKSNYIPWVLAGTAIGFGANLFKQLITWWIMPAIFKVEATDANKESLGNRLYPLEQAYVQDKIASQFEKWTTTVNLNDQQQDAVAGIESPLGSSNMYALGGAPSPAGLPPGMVGQTSPLVSTGRVGNCNSCGGMGGCYQNCPDLCSTCPDREGATECAIIVQAGDDLYDLAAGSGVDVNEVNAMNGGLPDTYWVAGNRVKLPMPMCIEVRRRETNDGSSTTTVVIPQQPNTPPVITTATPALPKAPPVALRPTDTLRDARSEVFNQPVAMMVSGLAEQEAKTRAFADFDDDGLISLQRNR